MPGSSAIQYDPDDPRSIDARRRILAVLEPLSRLYAAGFVGDHVRREMQLFNRRFNEFNGSLLDDPARLAITLMELVLLANRNVGALSALTSRPRDEMLRMVLE